MSYNRKLWQVTKAAYPWNWENTEERLHGPRKGCFTLKVTTEHSESKSPGIADSLDELARQ